MEQNAIKEKNEMFELGIQLGLMCAEKVDIDRLMDEAHDSVDPNVATVADVVSIFVKKFVQEIIGEENASMTVAEMDNEEDSGKKILEYMKATHNIEIDFEDHEPAELQEPEETEA